TILISRFPDDGLGSTDRPGIAMTGTDRSGDYTRPATPLSPPESTRVACTNPTILDYDQKIECQRAFRYGMARPRLWSKTCIIRVASSCCSRPTAHSAGAATS